MSEKLQLRDSHVESKGSFIRSLRQAQAKLRGAIYTIIVAEYFGLLNKDSLLGIVRMGELLSTAQGERTDEAYVEKILQVVDKLVA